MPHRQGRWQKEHIEGGCPRRIQDFLEPCLLLLVHCQEIHGYELIDSLEPFGFAANPVDSAPSTGSCGTWRIQVWSPLAGITATPGLPAGSIA